jgi:hypothetical protein
MIQTIRQKQILILLLALWLVACNPPSGDEPMVQATSTAAAPATAEPTATTEPTATVEPTATIVATTAAELTEAILDNLTYQGLYTETIQLVNGRYEGEPFVAGGTSRPTVTRLPLVAFGDLNGDGVDDAAVLLVENSGGSGSFVFLAAVINQGGSPENVSTILLGDRVELQWLAISDGQIVAEIVTHSDSDPLCCPSLVRRNIYALQEQLMLISSEAPAESFQPLLFSKKV